VDFLLVLIELLSLGVIAEALQASSGSKSVIQVEGVAPHQPFFFSTN